MNTPAESPANVVRVEMARRKVQGATDAMHAAVHDAHEAGVGPTEIATAAGVTRQTVYAWLGLR